MGRSQISVTKEDYFQDSRWFLEHGDFVNPKMIPQRTGPDLAHQPTAEEVSRLIREMLRQLRYDQALAKKLIPSFIRNYNECVDRGGMSESEVRNRLKPIRLAVEMNEILVPWKKHYRLNRRQTATRKDRGYHLEEIRLCFRRLGGQQRSNLQP